MGFFNPFTETDKQSGGGGTTADDVSFDNSNTELQATNIQTAIEELYNLIPSESGNKNSVVPIFANNIQIINGNIQEG